MRANSPIFDSRFWHLGFRTHSHPTNVPSSTPDKTPPPGVNVNLRKGMFREATQRLPTQLAKDCPGTAIMGLIFNAGRRGIGMVATRDIYIV